MIFSELYSAYYNTVAEILARIIDGERSEKELQRVVADRAFGESFLTILPSLKGEKWQLVCADMTTPLTHRPTMPLTLLQKRWLKAISLDPRIRLFDIAFEGLDGEEPLFTPEDYCIYDRYADGDPFEDEGYIARFRTILTALREKTPLKIEMRDRRGNRVQVNLLPERLEYSEKDDKFRLIARGCRYGKVVNLGRILSCKPYRGSAFSAPYDREEEKNICELTLKICNERNALERCMLHFAHFEKRAERIGNREYIVHIRYEKEDETEMVIRTLSFGPMVEVLAPAHFRNLIVERLKKQKICGLF